jgi:hypothetical protein
MSDNFGMVDCRKNGADQNNTLSGGYWKARAEDCVDTYDDKR